MRYLKIILTIIALLLAVQVAARILPSARAGGAQAVNIAEVGGKTIMLYGGSVAGIPVYITNK
jgi:hypothetical protein